MHDAWLCQRSARAVLGIMAARACAGGGAASVHLARWRAFFLARASHQRTRA
jgi:hypothetical protein